MATNPNVYTAASGTLAIPIGVVELGSLAELHHPPSYSTSATGLVPLAAGATDVFTITNPVGSGQVIRIWSMGMSGTAVLALTMDVGIMKRSTDNTGGTFALVSSVPHDSNNPPAVAIVRAYTSNPTTLGATVGTKRAYKFPLLASAVALSTPAPELFTRSGKHIQPYVLRPGELLAFNLGALAIVGGSLDLFFEWTESPV